MKCTHARRLASRRVPIATVMLSICGAVLSSSTGCTGDKASSGDASIGGAGAINNGGTGTADRGGRGGTGSVDRGGTGTVGNGGSGGTNQGGAETVATGGAVSVSAGGTTGSGGNSVGGAGGTAGTSVGTGGSASPVVMPAFPSVSLTAGASETAVRDALAQSLGTDEVMFIKRSPYNSDHYYTEYINSSWVPEGGIYILNLKTGATRSVVSDLPAGVFRRFDISFDAKKIVFDFKKGKDEGYRIYEAEIATGKVRQVTVPPSNEAELVKTYYNLYHHGTDDMDPAYLPDGGIVFTSTRSQLGTLCDGEDRFTSPNLHRIEIDGTKLQQLSVNATSEFTPTVLPDGRVLYSRWEYVDKASAAIKCQWAMYPNGAGSSEIYKNDINLPPSTTQGRIIPGTLNRYLFLGTPHYEWPQLGTIFKIDMSKDIRTRAPMSLFTPELDATDHTVITWKAGFNGNLYRDPYPLNDTQALAAFKPGSISDRFAKAGYGLYVVQTGTASSTQYQFYRDSAISCWQPMPVKVRPRPPVASINLDAELAAKNQAIVSVQDVYFGMENVPRGAVKYLRVMEQLPRPWTARHFWGGDGLGLMHAAISRNSHLAAQVRWGVVPVESDGSAQFTVPANRAIFFAALDKDYRLIQQERTFVNYKPGERRACIGCHETPKDVPPVSAFPIAFQRAPSEPGPQNGETTGPKVLDYVDYVQPVWDKNCVSCHGPTKKSGNLDLSGTPTTLFNTSYEQLMDRRGWLLGHFIDEDPRNPPETSMYLPAYSLYGNQAVLLKMLGVPVTLSGQWASQEEKAKALATTHAAIKLTASELQNVSEWLDTNLQYYGHYWGRRNIKYQSHGNFRPRVTFEQAIGTVNPSNDP
jgi:hypothetical protein